MNILKQVKNKLFGKQEKADNALYTFVKETKSREKKRVLKNLGHKANLEQQRVMQKK